LTSSPTQNLKTIKVISFLSDLTQFVVHTSWNFIVGLVHDQLQVIIELPHILAQALIYGIIVYAMMGFEWTAPKVFWNLYYTYFSFLYYTFYGMMTMAITPNPHIAAILSTSFYAVWCLFSGFIIPLSVCYTFPFNFSYIINIVNRYMLVSASGILVIITEQVNFFY